MNPENRYRNDVAYHKLVDMIEALIVQAKYTPSEIRECALLACIHHEMRYGQKQFEVPVEVEKALETLTDWRKNSQDKK